MRRNTDRRGAEILPLCAAGIFLVYLAFFPAVIYSVDGNSMIAVSESLVTGHGFAVPIAGLGVIGCQGVFYSRWYPLLSILASLLVGVAIFTSHHLGLPQHYVAALFAVTLSPILAAASAMMVGMLAQRLGATTRGATLAALGFAFGTIAPVYSRLFFCRSAACAAYHSWHLFRVDWRVARCHRGRAARGAGQADRNSPWALPRQLPDM
jgi:hypothetical protein